MELSSDCHPTRKARAAPALKFSTIVGRTHGKASFHSLRDCIAPLTGRSPLHLEELQYATLIVLPIHTSWDKCCDGASSTYNIRVVRSASASGPYADKTGVAATSGGGTLIAQGDSTWKGPGGQSVMVVGTKAYLVYHAYAASDGAAMLRLAELVWDADGWPVPVGP